MERKRVFCFPHITLEPVMVFALWSVDFQGKQDKKSYAKEKGKIF